MARDSARDRRRARKADRHPEVRAIGRGYGIALAVLAGIGALVSLYLTYIHVRLRIEPGWQSSCAIDTSVNCDAVILSPFGSLGGVPLSLLGAWFYGVAAWVALIGVRHGRFPRSPAAFLTVAGLVAVGVSVALGVVSATIIGRLCVLCATLYAINWALLVVAWRALRHTGESLAQAMSAERRHWRHHRAVAARRTGVALVALALLVFGEFLTGARSAVCEEVAAAAAGRPPSPTTLVIYSDFQCPHCKTLNATLRPIRENPRVRIVHRHYPLESLCNPRVTTRRHPGACLQARAAICAGAQQREPDFTDRLYEKGVADRDALVALAVSLGLERAAFTSCLESEGAAADLRASVEAAISATVRATPTVFVNGRRLIGDLTPTDLACLAGSAREVAQRRTSE